MTTLPITFAKTAHTANGHYGYVIDCITLRVIATVTRYGENSKVCYLIALRDADGSLLLRTEVGNTFKTGCISTVEHESQIPRAAQRLYCSVLDAEVAK